MVVGATFAVAWSPCIGPILGALLTLAAASGTALRGGALLAAYSLGLGVWFVAFALALGTLASLSRRVQRYSGALLAASGALFIVIGALMYLGEFARLNREFQSLGFLFGRTAEAESELAGGAGGAFGPLVAFFGGVVSFLSPCVLPLVPVYLANVAGEAALQARAGEAVERRRLLAHALAFVLGFALVFSAVGASAGLAGSLVSDRLELLAQIGGWVLIVLGLHLSGLVRLPYLERTYQLPAR
jgi:cytochrome c biogenesis protein CcdA